MRHISWKWEYSREHNVYFSFVTADLDLDYLERRGGETVGNENVDSSTKEEESPADTLDRVKVVFLGAPGVGKSSIIRVSTLENEDSTSIINTQ